eukprot:523982-Prorocentrum_minimum.AAC.2
MGLPHGGARLAPRVVRLRLTIFEILAPLLTPVGRAGAGVGAGPHLPPVKDPLRMRTFRSPLVFVFEARFLQLEVRRGRCPAVAADLEQSLQHLARAARQPDSETARQSETAK